MPFYFTEVLLPFLIVYMALKNVLHSTFLHVFLRPHKQTVGEHLPYSLCADPFQTVYCSDQF